MTTIRVTLVPSNAPTPAEIAVQLWLLSDLYDAAVLTAQKDVIGLKEWARGSTPGMPAQAHDLRLRMVGIGMGSMWIQFIEEAHHQLDMWSPIGILSYGGNQLLK